ncbi:Eukaryotic translation initiation factor 2 subunit beta [Candida viswanathii]|uniref:Eukaryotic translation initiation factor 2 subunit beta n=1 Tax=Candida viswanathii TaxID=5486 RepID=A0A367XRQ6_9ASCO|nr:Eukaryotic translation initiation factor 2 subunit beta [Candida viswanathii]
MSDLGFDTTLKKKKKSKKPSSASPAVEGTDSKESTPQPADASVDDLFSGLKKKKKSTSTKKSSEKSESHLFELLFGRFVLKKKKKKSTKSLDVDEFEQQLEEAGVEESTDNGNANGNNGTKDQSTIGLSYADLLSRFFTVLKTNNPELAGDRSGPKFRIPPPIVQREGSKKTMFANVQEIAIVLQRSPEHLIQYLFAELGTTGSIDGEKRLILKGKFQPKQMESVLRRYIIEYVTCKTCKSMNTELKRESANRLHS